MFIRPLTPEDRFPARMNALIAFHGRMSDPEEERADSLLEKTEAWGAFDESGVLMASLTDYDYRIVLDGTDVTAGGIGEASTLPEFRGQGAMRALFEAFLPAARQRGEALSMLCPSSHSLYRKFGYEAVCTQNSYEMPSDALADYRFEGRAELLRPGDSAAEHTDLYNRFARSCNLAATRTEERQKNLLGGPFWQTRKFCYLLREKDRAVAYVLFADDRTPAGSTLAVWDLAYDGRIGFEAILGFLARFSLDYDRIELWTPSGVELLSLIRSPRQKEIKKRTLQNFMVRAVNVQRILEALKKPADAPFVLRVRDPLIPENDGTFRAEGSVVRKTEETPDMELSVAAFSQLAVGGTGLSEAILRPDVEVYGNRETLERVFVRKSLFNTENF